MEFALIDDAKKTFNDYVSNYDMSDPKIKLKLLHTYHVVNISEMIAKSLNMDTEDTYLAKIIGLLHDIGRFEQLKRFGSFDDRNISHAALSIDVLFDKGMIRKFVPDAVYDDIIYSAIKYHSDFAIPGNMDQRTTTHCKLIRDSDKLDNFRVKLEEKTETYLDVTREELGSEIITDKIYEDMMSCRQILRSDRKTHLDVWVSFLGFIYDINFPFSFSYILDNKCIEKTIEFIHYTDKATFNKMKNIEKKALQYCRDHV